MTLIDVAASPTYNYILHWNSQSLVFLVLFLCDLKHLMQVIFVLLKNEQVDFRK